MTEGRLEEYTGELEEILKKQGTKVIPSKHLEKFNPLAAQIKRNLGENFLSITIVREGGNGKPGGVETVIFPEKLADYHLPNKSFPIRFKDCLISVFKNPGEKEFRIKINSSLGEMKYNTAVVTKAKKAVENILNEKRMGFSKKDYEFYKHNGRKVQFICTEQGTPFGNFKENLETRKNLRELSQHRYTIFSTGKLKNPHMPYHR